MGRYQVHNLLAANQLNLEIGNHFQPGPLVSPSLVNLGILLISLIAKVGGVEVAFILPMKASIASSTIEPAPPEKSITLEFVMFFLCHAF